MMRSNLHRQFGLKRQLSKLRHAQDLQRGGHVEGPGGPTDDRIPAMLSNGEYVLPADTVAKVGKHNLDKLRLATHKFTGKGDPHLPAHMQHMAYHAHGGLSFVNEPNNMDARHGAPPTPQDARPIGDGTESRVNEYPQISMSGRGPVSSDKHLPLYRKDGGSALRHFVDAGYVGLTDAERATQDAQMLQDYGSVENADPAINLLGAGAPHWASLYPLRKLQPPAPSPFVQVPYAPGKDASTTLPSTIANPSPPAAASAAPTVAPGFTPYQVKNPIGFASATGKDLSPNMSGVYEGRVNGIRSFGDAAGTFDLAKNTPKLTAGQQNSMRTPDAREKASIAKQNDYLSWSRGNQVRPSPAIMQSNPGLGIAPGMRTTTQQQTMERGYAPPSGPMAPPSGGSGVYGPKPNKTGFRDGGSALRNAVHLWNGGIPDFGDLSAQQAQSGAEVPFNVGTASAPEAAAAAAPEAAAAATPGWYNAAKGIVGDVGSLAGRGVAAIKRLPLAASGSRLLGGLSAMGPIDDAMTYFTGDDAAKKAVIENMPAKLSGAVLGGITGAPGGPLIMARNAGLGYGAAKLLSGGAEAAQPPPPAASAAPAQDPGSQLRAANQPAEPDFLDMNYRGPKVYGLHGTEIPQLSAGEEIQAMLQKNPRLALEAHLARQQMMAQYGMRNLEMQLRLAELGRTMDQEGEADWNRRVQASGLAPDEQAQLRQALDTGAYSADGRPWQRLPAIERDRTFAKALADFKMLGPRLAERGVGYVPGLQARPFSPSLSSADWHRTLPFLPGRDTGNRSTLRDVLKSAFGTPYGMYGNTVVELPGQEDPEGLAAAHNLGLTQ